VAHHHLAEGAHHHEDGGAPDNVRDQHRRTGALDGARGAHEEPGSNGGAERHEPDVSSVQPALESIPVALRRLHVLSLFLAARCTHEIAHRVADSPRPEPTLSREAAPVVVRSDRSLRGTVRGALAPAHDGAIAPPSVAAGTI